MDARLRTLLRDVGVNGLIGSYLVPRQLRWRALRAAGIPVEHSTITAGCFFGSRRISIGQSTFVNYGCFFDGAGRVTIGQDCQIGMQVLFCTGTHEIGPPDKRGGTPVSRPVTIGNGVWIGARATIMPGVTVGDGCIIAAGSLVTNDCAPNGLYLGSPAQRTKDLED